VRLRAWACSPRQGKLEPRQQSGRPGLDTSQQADTERLNLQAQEAAVAVAEANIRAQQALLEVLLQQKAYQRVVAPFDGVVTQRNIDNGSLVQADAAGGIPMFTLMHSDVSRPTDAPANE
jgi:multidrug efflux pump subunit AcrA (membrane-fusion protein)